MFESVKLTKNSNLDKQKYSGYGKEFDSRSESSLPDGSAGKNVIIFGADMISPVHNDDKEKDILILGKSPTQGLNNTMFTAETQYSINFTQPNQICIKSTL